MKTLSALAIGLLAATPAFAQDDTGPSLEEAAQQQVRARNQAPDLDVRTGFAGSGVQLNAGSDSTNVTLTASRSWDSTNAESLSFNTASLVITAPIDDKDKKEGAFLTEGGLPESFSVQGSFTFAFSGNPPLPATLEERGRIFKEEQAKCLAAAETRVTEAGKIAARAECKKLQISTGPGTALADPWNDTPVWFLGASAAVGRKKFDYRSIADFKEQDSNRTEYSFSGFFGVNPNSRPIYLGAGYEYRRQYKAPTSRTLCHPATGTNPQECFTGAFAKPEKDIDSSVFAVARMSWTLDLGGGAELPIGLTIKAAYDTKDKIFGIGAPLYLFSDSSGLRGGVRVDWQDVEDNDERFGVRVFIGTPFSLFGGG
jgi:hypothetical protein